MFRETLVDRIQSMIDSHRKIMQLAVEREDYANSLKIQSMIEAWELVIIMIKEEKDK